MDPTFSDADDHPADDRLPFVTAVIVCERGADWAPWVERFRRDCDDVVVVSQRGRESSSQLVARVRDTLAELDAVDGRTVKAALLGGGVLVGGGVLGAETLGARSSIIRALVSRVAAGGGGTLYLGAHGGGGDGTSMAALAATVRELVRGAGVVVCHTIAPLPEVA